jgi:transcriptional regulator with XRE-family HTH domain
MNEREKEYCKLVGGAIRKLRTQTGKSLRIFAYENDIPVSTLSCIEIGNNEVGITTLKKIAEGLELSMSELFRQIHKDILPDFKIIDI